MSFLTEKHGPLPAWAWLGMGVVGLILISVYKKNPVVTKASTTAPGDQTAPPVVVVSYPPVIVPAPIPPAGRPPTPKPKPKPPVFKPKWPKPPKRRPKVPPPKSHAPTPSHTGQYVTVAKWNDTNAPWNSTLWGIAQHFYGNGDMWHILASANHIADPKKIQPGQRILVPEVTTKGTTKTAATAPAPTPVSPRPTTETPQSHTASTTPTTAPTTSATPTQGRAVVMPVSSTLPVVKPRAYGPVETAPVSAKPKFVAASAKKFTPPAKARVPSKVTARPRGK